MLFSTCPAGLSLRWKVILAHMAHRKITSCSTDVRKPSLIQTHKPKERGESTFLLHTDVTNIQITSSTNIFYPSRKKSSGNAFWWSVSYYRFISKYKPWLCLLTTLYEFKQNKALILITTSHVFSTVWREQGYLKLKRATSHHALVSKVMVTPWNSSTKVTFPQRWPTYKGSIHYSKIQKIPP